MMMQAAAQLFVEIAPEWWLTATEWSGITLGKLVNKYRVRRRASTGRSTRRARQFTAIAAFAVAVGIISTLGGHVDPPTATSGTESVKISGTLLPKAASSTLIGRASVIDGDTIEIHGQHVRFDGIDAPEAAQTCKDAKRKSYRCGQDAALFLEKFITVSSPVRCEFVTFDQYDRFVGECFRADGASLNAAMVRSGYALDWPKHSKGKYASFQKDAKSENAGMWVGTFKPAWEFRAEQRAKLQQDAPANAQPSFAIAKPSNQGSSGSDCNIKGNISSETGERIYHVPGQRFYAKTRISTAKGEKWFCSEDDAIAAGWRRSMQ